MKYVWQTITVSVLGSYIDCSDTRNAAIEIKSCTDCSDISSISTKIKRSYSGASTASSQDLQTSSAVQHLSISKRASTISRV